MLGSILFTTGVVLIGISFFLFSLLAISFLPISMFEKKGLAAISNGDTNEYNHGIIIEPVFPELTVTQELPTTTSTQQPVQEKKEVKKTEAEMEAENIDILLSSDKT